MKKTNIPKIRAPKGFRFLIEKSRWSSDVYVQLVSSKEIRSVGRITLSRLRKDYYATHSSLNEKYHGKGLGTLMYARAIQYALEQGWKVRSSGHSSEKAQRVWRGKGLRQKFAIKTRKTGYNHHTWYAYPKQKVKRAP